MYYWARCEIDHAKHTKEPGRLLWPAYAFGDARFFNSLTKFMVLNLPNDDKAQNASAKYGIPQEIETHLPENVLGMFPDKSLPSAVLPTLTRM